jgi:hypothetical protein
MIDENCYLTDDNVSGSIIVCHHRACLLCNKLVVAIQLRITAILSWVVFPP